MAFDDSWLDDREDDECDDEDAITVTSQVTASEKDSLQPFGSLIGGLAGCRRVTLAPPTAVVAADAVVVDGVAVKFHDEVRMIDPDTGGEKGSKLARFDLIPADPLRQLAEHYGKGAEKYEERNWERGYAWSLTYAALQRHANAFWDGEDIDPDSRSHHMVAVAWHALALVEFARTHKEKDNRPHG